MPRSQAQVTHQDAVLEGCRGASNVRASSSLVAQVEDTGKPARRLAGASLGTSRDDQLALPRKVNWPEVSRDFATKGLPSSPLVVAPDGSLVRVLLDLPGGGLAQFTLPPGQTSQAVYHKTVEEIWFIVSGQGQMWRRLGKHDETVPLRPGSA